METSDQRYVTIQKNTKGLVDASKELEELCFWTLAMV
jgi:hypothetical protein